MRHLTQYSLMILLVFFSFGGRTQEKFEKGVIIDSVFTPVNGESFALYLPKDYDENKKHPLILILDPMARGTTGIKPFVLSAESHGYILACSNDSRNGPFEPNLALGQRMHQAVLSIFEIDDKRVYTAGFSGGARLASWLAIRNPAVTGVIACGAGLGEGVEYELLARRFQFAGIIGNRDMNFMELQGLESILARMSFPNNIITVNQDHRWPEPESVLMATDWLQLEYLKAYPGKLRTNEIKKICQRAYDYIRNQSELEHWIEAAEGYDRLLGTYRRYVNSDSIRVKREELLDSRAYKAEKRAFDAALSEEKILTQELLIRFAEDLMRSKNDLKWWRKQLEKLDSKSGKENRHYQNMADRTKYKIYANAIEMAEYRLLPEAHEQKAFCYELCMLTYPNYYYPYFRRIELALEIEDRNKALDYLRIMIENGYKDRARLESSRVGRQLQNEPEFRSILEQLGGGN